MAEKDLTQYEIWTGVARLLRGDRKLTGGPNYTGGLCYFLGAFTRQLTGSRWDCEWYLREEARLEAACPSEELQEGYWWPPTREGDRKRLALCRRLAGPKPKRRVK